MPVNIKNPAIKRIHADVRELMKDPSDQYHAAPLESNLFEWHFTLRGPPDTPFEGGVYHGRILLPPDYPFRPPDIMFTTPNGRFSLGTKICLTISSYHPEYWQPAWGIRLILEALISFLPSPSMGAIGGLDWTDAERRRLAVESNEWKCYKCGHAKALLPELRATSENEAKGSGPSNRFANQIKELHRLKVKTAEEFAAAAGSDAIASPESKAVVHTIAHTTAASSDVAALLQNSSNGSCEDQEVISVSSTRVRNVVESRSGSGAEVRGGESKVGDATPKGTPIPTTDSGSTAGQGASEETAKRKSQSKDDDLLTYLAVAIAFAIAGILFRKILRHIGV